jgi:hypothetical protein
MNPRAMTPAERARLLADARRIHSPTTCVFLVDRDELPALNVPSELAERRAVCVVCGRRAEPSDRLGPNTLGARA